MGVTTNQCSASIPRIHSGYVRTDCRVWLCHWTSVHHLALHLPTAGLVLKALVRKLYFTDIFLQWVLGHTGHCYRKE